MKEDNIESIWAGMRNRELERELERKEREIKEKWYREYILSPNMRKWLEWKEYESMRREFNKSIFTWKEIVAYKKRIGEERKEAEKFECPICNTILDGDTTDCVFCGWTKSQLPPPTSPSSPASIEAPLSPKESCMYQELDYTPTKLTDKTFCKYYESFMTLENCIKCSIRKISRTISKNIQKEVWKRDFGRCVQCGSNERIEFTHIIPFIKGRSKTAKNIQLLCEKCNMFRGRNI